jgi:tetraacyldisaccharide 4'-kinase
MPAGPLRETVAAGLARADAVVALGGGDFDAAALAGPRPVLRARLEPTAAARSVTGHRVLAFAGIGRPEKFFATLGELGCAIVASRAFPDHHPFEPDEIMRLVEAAQAQDAIPVTTEKDHVRLPPAARAMVTPVAVRLRFADDEAVDRLLDRIAP